MNEDEEPPNLREFYEPEVCIQYINSKLSQRPPKCGIFDCNGRQKDCGRGYRSLQEAFRAQA